MFFSLSNAFDYDYAAHQSKKAVDGYVLYHDELMHIKDANFPKGVVDLTVAVHHGKEGDHHSHGHDDAHGNDHHQTVDEHGVHDEKPKENTGGNIDPRALLKNLSLPTTKGKEKEEAHAHYVIYEGKQYEIEPASKLQGLSSWYDFSITKNVFSMFLAFILLILIFSTVSKAYKKRKGMAPKGIQSLLEPIIVFMRDEVVRPAIGHKWEKFFPFVMTMFFFVLICNLMGLIPFFPGSANITGNIGVTLVLATFTFLITNLNGNGHYWRHVFAMPGVPPLVLLILTPIEVVGLFIKPITLLIRLFANITAGHIIILSLVSLIFVFSNSGESLAGAFGGGAIAVPFIFAMNFLELFVAFLQAFIFALLTSLYIGSAVEEHHHEEAH